MAQTTVPRAALPALYSFRRCPYAIRARMALLQSGLSVELREVVLRDKPAAMLQASPKGTVPVLVLPHGTVIDESLAIMRWALAQSDPQEVLQHADDPECLRLIALNDGPFKRALDAYKYPERHPEQSVEAHRTEAEQTLVSHLEKRLSEHAHLWGSEPGFADLAIFPFIRQWAAVDRAWFDASRWTQVRRWLDGWLQDPSFLLAMRKWPRWHPEQRPVIFPD